MATTLTKSGTRLYSIICKRSAQDRERGGEGWIEKWDAIEQWGLRMSVHFVFNAGSRCYDKLLESGLIEEHSTQPDLIRAKDVTP